MSKHILIHHRYKVKNRKHGVNNDRPLPEKEGNKAEEVPLRKETRNQEAAAEITPANPDHEAPEAGRSSAGPEEKDITD